MNRCSRRILVHLGFSLLLSCGCAQPPPKSAQEVIARSLAAHGGDALTRWKTMTIRGKVVMNDGIDYNAAYILMAEKPGKLRMEQDLTADRGRLFFEYFLNSGVAWSRRNLIPSRGDVGQMQRLLHQCDGVAYYADNADSLVLKDEGVVEIKERSGAEEEKILESIPAYVVEATVGEEKTELYVDKRTYYLIQEKYDNRTQIYSNFKTFDSVVLPTKITEIVTTQRGERILPITYETVEYDTPIESWLFEEDMPKTGGGQP